jgi:hypothetical protein
MLMTNVFRRHASAAVIGALLLASLITTIYGLTNLQLKDLPWSGQSALLAFSFFLAAVFSITVTSRQILGISTPVTVLILSLIICTATGNLGALIFTATYTLSATCLGSGIARQLGWKQRYRNWPLFFLLGAGVLGTVIGWMSHFPVAYPAVYALFMAAPLLIFKNDLFSLLGETRKVLATSADRHRVGSDNLVIGLIVAVGSVHFIVSLLPELSHDGLAMHLFVPSYVKSLLEWSYDPSLYVWALMPLHGDWLFSFAYVLSGEAGVKLLSLCHLYVLGVFAYRLVIWAHGSQNGALWCVLIFLSTPLTFTLSSGLFVDAVWSSYLVAAAYMLFAGNDFDHPRVLYVPVAAFLGFAFASKLGTLTYAPVFLLMLPVFSRGTLRGNAHLPSVLLGIFVFFLTAAHPYLAAWIISGNPVFPFFNAFFQSPYYPSVNFTNSLFSAYLSWDIPYRMVFNSSRFMEATNGASGFQWLMLLPAAVSSVLLAQNRRALILLLLGILPLILTFQGQSYLRYVFPSTILICSAIFTSITTKDLGSAAIKRLFTVCLGMTLTLNLVFFCSGTWTYRAIPFAALLSSENTRDFLKARMPLRTLVSATNIVNQERSPVAMIAPPYAGGLSSDVLFANWYNSAFSERLSSITGANDFSTLITNYSAELVILSPDWISSDNSNIVMATTDELFGVGGYSLRRLKAEYRYGEELLNNAEVASPDDWYLGNGAIYDPQLEAFLVTVSHAASQVVSVRPLRHYLLTAVAGCHEERTEGRLQVNWLDDEGNIVEVAISTFECEFETKAFTAELQAPAAATLGIVYASGHHETPLYFEALSLK